MVLLRLDTLEVGRSRGGRKKRSKHSATLRRRWRGCCSARSLGHAGYRCCNDLRWRGGTCASSCFDSRQLLHRCPRTAGGSSQHGVGCDGRQGIGPSGGGGYLSHHGHGHRHRGRCRGTLTAGRVGVAAAASVGGVVVAGTVVVGGRGVIVVAAAGASQRGLRGGSAVGLGGGRLLLDGPEMSQNLQAMDGILDADWVLKFGVRYAHQRGAIDSEIDKLFSAATPHQAFDPGSHIFRCPSDPVQLVSLQQQARGSRTHSARIRCLHLCRCRSRWRRCWRRCPCDWHHLT
mmetsp:Transcript_58865/g.124835  ORF Transcript_58865/g.124835 Transcript_58865/m.124835 type:complete len:289 (+) Transcript_58865:1185-2051(+)